MSVYGYSGSSYDKFVENTNTSTLHKMKETYWTTKQAVIKKLGKKEDEHVVASDSQLDAKLEVFKAIQKSSMDLLRVIERYQERLCIVSQEENTMGRLLKSHSNKDKTRAGKMMAAVGKAESNSAQERLALHNPLRRLYQEVETFRYRAVSDTLVTINRMESARTEYRGALLWMKKVSEELDPDMFKQLEKFRKVQGQVRKTKARFDKLKLDVMQKVDLLAASRCNMYSHVLANYQTMLLHYWEKTSRTLSAVAESFKGYQYYEFNMLKELSETSKKLSLESGTKEPAERDTEEGDDSLISVGAEDRDALESTAYDDKLLDFGLGGGSGGGGQGGVPAGSKRSNGTGNDDDDLLKDDEDEDLDFTGKILEAAAKNREVRKTDRDSKHKDLLGEDTLEDESEVDKDDMTLLNEILNAPSTGEDEFTTEWTAVFGGGAPATSSPDSMPAEPDLDLTKERSGFLPSSLLDTKRGGDPFAGMTPSDPGMLGLQGFNLSDPSGSLGQQQPSPSSSSPSGTNNAKGQKQKPPPLPKGANTNMSAWFNLFADLDPLSNPDAIGRRPDDMTDA